MKGRETLSNGERKFLAEYRGPFPDGLWFLGIREQK